MVKNTFKILPLIFVSILFFTGCNNCSESRIEFKIKNFDVYSGNYRSMELSEGRYTAEVIESDSLIHNTGVLVMEIDDFDILGSIDSNSDCDNYAFFSQQKIREINFYSDEDITVNNNVIPSGQNLNTYFKVLFLFQNLTYDLEEFINLSPGFYDTKDYIVFKLSFPQGTSLDQKITIQIKMNDRTEFESTSEKVFL